LARTSRSARLSAHALLPLTPGDIALTRADDEIPLPAAFGRGLDFDRQLVPLPVLGRKTVAVAPDDVPDHFPAPSAAAPTHLESDDAS